MTALIAQGGGGRMPGPPSSTSAMAGPTAPRQGAPGRPQQVPRPSSTAVSPRFMYPPVGDGTFTTMVGHTGQRGEGRRQRHHRASGRRPAPPVFRSVPYAHPLLFPGPPAPFAVAIIAPAWYDKNSQFLIILSGQRRRRRAHLCDGGPERSAPLRAPLPLHPAGHSGRHPGPPGSGCPPSGPWRSICISPS